MEILSKKFVILLEIATGDYYSITQIAEKVGITKQGVSEYLKKMKEENLIEIIGGKYKATMKGIDKIFSYINQIDKYLEEKKKKLNMIKYCSAIADDDIKKGERVYLFMKNGYLYACKKRESTAFATAIENAKKGEDIAITNIRGIIPLNLGKIYIFSLPSVLEGGSKAINIKNLKQEMDKKIKKIDKIGILDIIGKISLEKLGVKYDIEYDVINASIEASQKGLNILLIGSKDEARMAIKKIEEYNENAIKEIEYDVISL